MTQSIAKTEYNEVSAYEEQAELTSKKTVKKHRSYTRSWWSTTFSKNRMKIICTGLVLVSIVAGSVAFFISSQPSWFKKTFVENDPGDTMVFDDLNKDKEVQEFTSSNDYDNTDDRLPQLRSYTGQERRRFPDSLGHMNIYIKKDNRQSYRRFRSPVARYDRRRMPLRGPFLNFMPWVPIFADRLTKQTIIYSQAGVYIIPPVINTYGQLFSVAQLIAAGYASLVSSGVSLYGNADMLRYFQPQPLIGPGLPVISPLTGVFSGGIRGNFGSFPNTRHYGARSNIHYSQEIEEEGDDDYDEPKREPNNYRPGYNPYKNNIGPYKNNRYTRKTTSLQTGATLPVTGATIPVTDATIPVTGATLPVTGATLPSSQPPALKCESDEKDRTPFTLKPFQDIFENPKNITPLLKECRSDGHCIFSYSIVVNDTRLSPFNKVIPECASKPGTKFITYNNQIPGPTFVVPTGHESIVRFHNIIGNYFKESFPPCNGSRTGRPIGIHHHGAASLSPYDGWADDETCVGETKEYVYPDNRPATEWYHDHALHITADNAYSGLAGLYINTSKKKYGGCGEPWNLEDIEEKHLILQDKVLDSDCQLVLDKEGFDKISFYGDINLVSGIPFPLMNLEPKWYRFRLLNAAVSRPFLLKIKNAAFQDISQQICKIIATDGGFRRQPVTFPSAGLLIGVAERYEMVCDFTTLKGQTLYLWNDKDDDWMKDVLYFCYSHYLAKLEISSETPTSSPQFDENIVTPEPERTIERALTAENIAEAMKMADDGKFHRKMHFERSGGQWVINGETWDSFKIAAEDIGQNTWELWMFQTGGGWFHPVHVHLVDFYIIKRDRDGGLKEYENLSPKDILYLGPSQKIFVIIRFGPHRGDYMFHCHNLIHEDDDMMRAFRINYTQNGLNRDTAEPFIHNQVTNIIYSNFKYADPMLTETAAKPTALMPALDSTYMKNMLNNNVYRIFYPTQADDILLTGFTNPWKSQWCPV